ncbi:protein NLP7-like [Camellia sinensis]|uniref:protein NLP7-like n=1 Tax=Camellia sinensis TaxID=4442 RepID=UPI001035720B|nr:protein NLP7-like [Camellia sinensis]
MAESDFSRDEEGRVAAYFPDDFKQYEDAQLNRCPVVDNYDEENIFCGWVFWSREDDQSDHPPDILDLKKKIKDVLRQLSQRWFGCPTLAQFWVPTMTTEGRSYLTTENQPFALCTLDRRIDDDVKELCGYRMISKDYKFYMDSESSDEQLGVPGRVFKHGLPECTPNVEYYSIKEYPLRDHALLCQVEHSWAVPMFELSTHLCVGVLQIVSTTPSERFQLYNNYDWLFVLKDVGLLSSISHANRGTDFNVRHTGNDIYVLECFMPPGIKDYGNQQTALRKILETMKKNFQTFKLASGDELGEHLCIEEISFQNGENLDSAQMSQTSQTTKSLPRVEPLQSGGEMTQLDLSSQQSVDALHNEWNVVSAEQSNIDVTCSQEKGKTEKPKRVHNRTGAKIEIPLDDILQNAKRSIQVAADNLKVSRSTLKRVCRSYGFSRWPPHNKNMVGSSQPSESSPGVDHQQIPQLSSDQPFSQPSTAVVHSNPHNTVIQDANIVTVKASYINDIIIKFPLPLSSGLVELQQQIAKRLNLEAGSYHVKYKDEEDDMILIACDEDLQNCIGTYRLPRTSIMVSVEPKSITIDQMMASFEENLLFE